MAQTIYLTRNGLLEPLGQSQVLAYLRGLSRSYAITLITYEKAEDWADTRRMAQARAECQALGIRWLPQRFLRRPPLLAPALGLIHMVWLLWREVRNRPICLVHARSYIPAAAALAVFRLTGTPFIFDMRALWPEELITAQRIRRGSSVHRALVRLERACLAHAAAIVSLTHAAVEYLKQFYPQELTGKDIAVIPTCADLERFKPGQPLRSGPMVHGCIGTVLSGWFRIDWLACWIAVASQRDPDAIFEIVTRDDATLVRNVLDPEGHLAERLRIVASESRDMPVAVRRHDLSIMFFTDGRGKLGSAPTRLAEVLGSGLPVVANPGVGDVAAIVRDNRVGVLLDNAEPTSVATAVDEIEGLMRNPSVADRCRETALRLFSLEGGTEAYRAIYADIAEAR